MSVLYRNVSYGFVGLKEKKEQKKKNDPYSHGTQYWIPLTKRKQIKK